MMKNFLVFFLTLIVLFSTSCGKAERPKFERIQKVKIESINSGRALVSFEAVIFNPNPVGCNLSGIDMDIEIEEKTAGKVKQSILTEIPANNRIAIPLEADIDLKSLKGNLLGTALSMLTKNTVKLHFKGDVKVRVLEMDIPIPVDQEKEVPLKNLKLF